MKSDCSQKLFKYVGREFDRVFCPAGFLPHEDEAMVLVPMVSV